MQRAAQHYLKIDKIHAPIHVRGDCFEIPKKEPSYHYHMPCRAPRKRARPPSVLATDPKK